MCLWMSTEKGDNCYIPARSALRKPLPTRTTSKPTRTARKDYTEVQVISDQEDNEGAVNPGEVDYDFKLESPDSESVQSEPCWTPRTFSDRMAQLTKQISEFAHQTVTANMAKQTEPNMTAILQLMMEMKSEDRKAEQRREIGRRKEGEKLKEKWKLGGRKTVRGKRHFF